MHSHAGAWERSDIRFFGLKMEIPMLSSYLFNYARPLVPHRIILFALEEHGSHHQAGLQAYPQSLQDHDVTED